MCLLAEVEEGIVGYLAGYVRAGSSLRPVPVAELESMYVAEEHRGGRVGERLVASFRSWARERGAWRTSVTAHAANERAIRFYKRAGFRAKNVTLEVGPWEG